VPRQNDPGVTGPRPLVPAPSRSPSRHHVTCSCDEPCPRPRDPLTIKAEWGAKAVATARLAQRARFIAKFKAARRFVSALSTGIHSAVSSPFPETRRNSGMRLIFESRARECGASRDAVSRRRRIPDVDLQVIAYSGAREASSLVRRVLLRDTQELPSFVASLEQPAQRRRRVPRP
jgi:hypothetical protein